MKAHTRGADLCARLGGEEFVLAISHVQRAGVEIAIERLRARVESERLEWRRQVLYVTASFGVAGTHDKGGDFQELLRQADAALYAAKNRGRNRVEFAEEK